jgi:hypothetical protein
LAGEKISISARRYFGAAGGISVKNLSWILVVLIAAGSISLGHAQGSLDEQSLKTAHETMVQNIEKANLVVLQAMIHPRALGFFRDSHSPAQIRREYTAADALPSVVADIAKFVAVPTDTVYRVVGQVGIVCMTTAMQAKKGEKQSSRYLRGTYVYIAEGGNWKLLSWHGSDTPPMKD